MSVYAPYNQNESSGSIRLNVDANFFEPFPDEANWKGVQLLKKSEFHATLLHAKSHQSLSSISNDRLASFFNEFVSKSPITLLSFIDDFRYVEEEEKKTIIVRCEVSNLDQLFAAFSAKFETQLPRQPAHVTLYSLEKTVGIHINSDEHMERLERVKIPELEKAFLTLT